MTINLTSAYRITTTDVPSLPWPARTASLLVRIPVSVSSWWLSMEISSVCSRSMICAWWGSQAWPPTYRPSLPRWNSRLTCTSLMKVVTSRLPLIRNLLLLLNTKKGKHSCDWVIYYVSDLAPTSSHLLLRVLTRLVKPSTNPSSAHMIALELERTTRCSRLAVPQEISWWALARPIGSPTSTPRSCSKWLHRRYLPVLTEIRWPDGAPTSTSWLRLRWLSGALRPDKIEKIRL